MSFDRFDPVDYPHGIVCPACGTPLTVDNVMRVDITDEVVGERQPWEQEQPDEPKVWLMGCLDCVISNKVQAAE